MVSVILPNYNHVAFLKQRIDSILAQQYTDFELIILDDCSRDGSRSIIESYRGHEKIVAIIYNDSNSGSTYKQWKKGIEHAQGTYVWIAESDDYADAGFLCAVMDVFERNKKIGLVYTRSLPIDHYNKPVSKPPGMISGSNDKLWSSDFSMSGLEFVKRYMLGQNPIPNASAVVFKRDIYESIGGVQSNYTINGDWNLYSRILSVAHIGYINQDLNFFRQHGNRGSLQNSVNGNNLKELYWLAFDLVRICKLAPEEISGLKERIFRGWFRNVGVSLLLKRRFYNVIPSAYKFDKMVPFKILNHFIEYYWYRLKRSV